MCGNISLSQLSVIDGGEWLAPSCGRFTWGKGPPVSTEVEGGWTSELILIPWRTEKYVYAYSREILYLKIEGKYALRNVPKNLHSIKTDTYTAESLV